MAGADLRHDTIKNNSNALFLAKLRSSSCFLTSSDFKVATAKRDVVFYPDLAIHCHARPQTPTQILDSPTLVLEILSPSTRKYDLTAKRKEYFRIPTLRHYLLLDSEAVEATLFTRDAKATWPKDPERFSDPKSLIPLPALGFSLKLRDLYRDSGLL